jgi:hypothetical protein
VKDYIVITTDQVQTILGGGGTVVDQDGGKVGTVESPTRSTSTDPITASRSVACTPAAGRDHPQVSPGGTP